MREERLATAADEPARVVIRARTTISFNADMMIEAALNDVVQQALPVKTLERVKRFLRRECRKPIDMTLREWSNHILRINEEEIPMLPPFGNNQMLREDEVVDILLYGTPRSWQREMDRQGFDPMVKTLAEVVAFMEQIEMSEEGTNPGSDNSKKQQAKNNGKSTSAKGDGNGKKFCLLHGNGNHSTDECHKLIADDKRHKSEYSSGTPRGKTHVNRTWKKQAAEGSASSKKELAAFVKKAVQKGVQKELAAIDSKKKRKSDDDAFDNELHAFDMDLKDFNYDDMNNLSISDGECSEAEA